MAGCDERESDQALLQGIQAADLSAVEDALGKGANAEAQDAEGYAALALAAQHCDECIGILIESGASVNARSGRSYSTTALELAILANSPTAVQSLLAAGADIELRHPDTGSTPLMTAAIMASPEVVAVLVESGASLEAENRGLRAVDFARDRARREDSAEAIIMILEAAERGG